MPALAASPYVHHDPFSSSHILHGYMTDDFFSQNSILQHMEDSCCIVLFQVHAVLLQALGRHGEGTVD